MREDKQTFWLVLVLLLLLSLIIGIPVNTHVTTFSQDAQVDDDHSMTQKTNAVAGPRKIETGQPIGGFLQENLVETIRGDAEMLRFSSLSSSASFSRHIMCRDYKIVSVIPLRYNPIDPTTIFSPSDTKAVVLTTISVDNKIEFKWYYRSNSSKTWVFCYNWTQNFTWPGEYDYAGWLDIAGYWPGSNYPRAYKVEVCLDGSPFPSFAEFFEVTNSGLNNPYMCNDVDLNGNPVFVKSRFTIGADMKAHHYLRFEKIAYFNEELEICHSFTTVWIQPDGSSYKTYSGNFSDYKDTDVTWDYWQSKYIPGDYISINSTTPVGNWKVDVYLDSYLNNTWKSYGPVATTPFIVGNEAVADWTFMVYLDADVNVTGTENAGVDVFEEIASVGSSPQVNIVVQMDRYPGQDSSYGNWTDCKRFSVIKGMTPTPENAALDLGEVNMGDPSALRDFVNWTIGNYAANYYFLVIWDHGAGFVGCCFDSSTPQPIDFLTLPELSLALSELPIKVDVVLLDACGMSMTEVAYHIRDHANVLVGQEGLGWSPAPYNEYLSTLISNPSMLPNEFVLEVVTCYINWCKLTGGIQNATMSATDLTKIKSLVAAINDFALKLKENDILHHEQISLARNLTERYPGPYASQYNYYVDLYHFAQLARQYVTDGELQNAAYSVMTTLESTISVEDNKACPNSHGLSIFFPNEKGKFDSFGNGYEETAFARDTSWDEFLKYHLSGFFLTIKTPYTNITMEFEGEPYKTDAQGKLQLFVPSGSYNVTAPTLVYNVTGPSSRGNFTGWNDSTNPSRTITITGPVTYTAYYKTQYQVTLSQIGIGTDFANSVLTLNGAEYNATDLPFSSWCENGSTISFAFQSPLIAAPNVKRYFWNSSSGLSPLQNASIRVSTPGSITGNYKTQHYLDITSAHGSPTPTRKWFETGESINVSVTSPVSGSTGTRYVCIGWIGSGSVSTSGTTTYVVFTIENSSSMTWNWKIQYLLSMRLDPTGLNPPPNVSPAGPWYDNSTAVNCTAQTISGYAFDQWIVDGVNWDRGINSVSITMHGPHEVTAHYEPVIAWWENIFRSEMLKVLLVLTGLFFAIALVRTALVRTKRRGIAETPKPASIEVAEVLPGRVATGYADLDKLLLGGIPENYAVILTSPACDERDLIIKRFLETGAKNGEATFYITIDPAKVKSLAKEFQSSFYLFICNPQADTIIKEDSPNVFKIKGVESLTQISIALTSALHSLDERARALRARRMDDWLSIQRRACIEIISDVLLQHQAVQTRRWLTDLVTEFRSESFTTLAVMTPQMHQPEEIHAILDLFEGEINISEKEAVGSEKFLRIRKMYNQKYIETELPLRKDKLES